MLGVAGQLMIDINGNSCGGRSDFAMVAAEDEDLPQILLFEF